MRSRFFDKEKRDMYKLFHLLLDLGYPNIIKMVISHKILVIIFDRTIIFVIPLIYNIACYFVNNPNNTIIWGKCSSL